MILLSILCGLVFTLHLSLFDICACICVKEAKNIYVLSPIIDVCFFWSSLFDYCINIVWEPIKGRLLIQTIYEAKNEDLEIARNGFTRKKNHTLARTRLKSWLITLRVNSILVFLYRFGSQEKMSLLKSFAGSYWRVHKRISGSLWRLISYFVELWNFDMFLTSKYIRFLC